MEGSRSHRSDWGELMDYFADIEGYQGGDNRQGMTHDPIYERGRLHLRRQGNITAAQVVSTAGGLWIITGMKLSVKYSRDPSDSPTLGPADTVSECVQEIGVPSSWQRRKK
ncbi:hypothetical protein J6590_031709 [Homalodisca vitripennis]|nr:hypothetical protein J6590_031709 [Homalodisca vitripennis]